MLIPAQKKVNPGELYSDSFTCPYCHAFAQMHWIQTATSQDNTGKYNDKIVLCSCNVCRKTSIWNSWYSRGEEGRIASVGKMIFPIPKPPIMPHEHLPQDLKVDYQEALAVFTNSPRSSCALLRLIIQKLIQHLGETEENLNKAIGNLVKKGLSTDIQKALDFVRVIGNNAVHPGQIDKTDVAEMAISLFELVNIIAEELIAKPAKIAALYDRLPDGAIAAINKRDSKA